MGEGKQFSSAVSVFNPSQLSIPTNSSESPPQNPLLQIQSKFKELEIGFDDWVSKQPFYIEAAVSTARGAALGAIIGVITAIGRPVPPVRPGLDPNSLCSYKAFSGPPLVQARKFAVLVGVDHGISTVMKRLKGKEDIQCRMIAAFGSGAMFSLVNGMGGASEMATLGLFGLLVRGVAYTLRMKAIGLLKIYTYEKKFKKDIADYTEHRQVRWDDSVEEIVDPNVQYTSLR